DPHDPRRRGRAAQARAWDPEGARRVSRRARGELARRAVAADRARARRRAGAARAARGPRAGRAATREGRGLDLDRSRSRHARRLRALGVERVDDRRLRRPRRYESAADEVAIAELWGDEEVAIAGVVQDVRLRRPRRGLTILTARVGDATGSISATWFNQPWL